MALIFAEDFKVNKGWNLVGSILSWHGVQAVQFKRLVVGILYLWEIICDFMIVSNNFGLFSDIYELISFKVDMMIMIASVYVLVPFK